MDDLHAAFHRAALAQTDEFRRVIGHAPTRALQMIGKYGAVEATRKLIQAPTTSGLTELYLVSRLDLSLEWLVVQDRYRALFTEDELRRADKTLRDHGFRFPPGYKAP